MVTYQSQNYSSDLVRGEYISFVGGMLRLCEVNDKNLTIRESFIHPDDIDPEKVERARRLIGHFPKQVKV